MPPQSSRASLVSQWENIQTVCLLDSRGAKGCPSFLHPLSFDFSESNKQKGREGGTPWSTELEAPSRFTNHPH